MKGILTNGRESAFELEMFQSAQTIFTIGDADIVAANATTVGSIFTGNITTSTVRTRRRRLIREK